MLEAGGLPRGIFPLALLTRRASRGPQRNGFLAEQALLGVLLRVCICDGWIRGSRRRCSPTCGCDEGLHRFRVGTLRSVEGTPWIGWFSGLVAHAFHHQPA